MLLRPLDSRTGFELARLRAEVLHHQADAKPE